MPFALKIAIPLLCVSLAFWRLSVKKNDKSYRRIGAVMAVISLALIIRTAWH